jgi:hypothetical protein
MGVEFASGKKELLRCRCNSKPVKRACPISRIYKKELLGMKHGVFLLSVGLV